MSAPIPTFAALALALGCQSAQQRPPAAHPRPTASLTPSTGTAATSPSTAPPPETTPPAESPSPAATVDPATLVYPGWTAEEYFAKATDPAMPAGTRLVALQMYARTERDDGHGDEAARKILALRGTIDSPFGDPALDAVALTEAASAIPLLLGTGALAHCEGADQPDQRVTPETLRDPKATLTIDITDAFATLAVVYALVERKPDSKQAADAVPDFIAALKCGDQRIRMLAGQSIGNVHRLRPAEAAALRELVLHHPRAHTRGLAATLVALAPGPATVTVLEGALKDGDELVRLYAAAALLRLNRPAKALPMLESLKSSANPEVASTAAQALNQLGPGAGTSGAAHE